jgi:DNA-binding transcriptional LysR family regulator
VVAVEDAGEPPNPMANGVPREAVQPATGKMSECVAREHIAPEGRRIQCAVEGGELGSIIALTAEGLGPAVIPSIVAITDSRLHVLRLQSPGLRREIALVRRRNRQLSRAATALSNEITTSLKEVGWPGQSPEGLKICV